ncbi:MAG: BatA domain-containing protein [Cyclobacteriaceae bacterium]
MAPYFLLGLGALLVPVIIHMWSKDAKKSVAFGSLRFLKETETRTTRSIMPSQWLLLLLRLLLLTAIVFFIADLRWETQSERSDRMYLIDPYYEGSEVVKGLLDTVQEGTDLRWLADGYPLLDEPLADRKIDYWQLLAEMPEKETKCLVVISPLHQKNFIGESKKIPEVCEWIVPPVLPVHKQLTNVEKAGNYLRLVASYDEWSTKIVHEETYEGSLIEFSYYLISDEQHQSQADIFKAALSALQEVSLITLHRVDEMDQADWVLWLSSNEPPKNESMIRVGNVLNWTQLGDNIYVVPDNLTQEEAIRADLPRLILDAFANGIPSSRYNDLLTVDPSNFEYRASIEGSLKTMEDVSNYLWVLLVMLLIIERWMSYKSSLVR